jgi:diguanylate cyclase (GGDEF)-like protein
MKELYFDELTGSYNRRFLHNWIDNETKRASRFGTKFALIMLDLDDFRNINNNFGHLEGDKVLVQFAAFLKQNIREVDNLIRYGGDEFIILMPNTHEKGTIELAQRIIDSINVTEIHSHAIHCSIGYAVCPDDGKTTDDLIRQADNLMYQAKKQGKNRIGSKEQIHKKLEIPCTVTIGRDDEANWCLGQLKDYPASFVAGEAGVGKTRLVFEVKKRLMRAQLLRGNAYAALSGVPYHPFKNLFSELIATQYGMVQRLFQQMQESQQVELAKIFPAESMIKVGPEPGLDKYRLFQSVARFLNDFADAQPQTLILLLIDDLHWLDRPSCELFDFLIRSIHPSIKIFGTFRIEEIESAPVANLMSVWSREKLYTQIVLPPLSEAQTYKLLKAITGRIPQSAMRHIYQQSGGNPFYIEEILRELTQRQKLYWNGREWGFARKIDVVIPSSIEETIRRKLTFLDPEIKHYLEIAAVYGQEFTADVIAIACKRNVGQIMDALDELTRLGLIKERTSEMYFFSEDIVRQIVYNKISRGLIMQYHKTIGEAIESIYRNAIPNFYEQLAHHFSVANEPYKALYYCKKAAMKAKDNYAHSLAIRFFENALRYEDSIEEIFETKFALAEIYALTANYTKAIELLNVCLKINPNSYKVFERLGKVYEETGDYKQSFKYYQNGLKLTQGADAMYTFLSDIAWLHTRLAEFNQALNECKEILKRKEQLSKVVLSDAYTVTGVVHLRLGNLDEAEDYIKKALKIRQSIGDKRRIAACYIDLAISYQNRFNVRMCEKCNSQALRLCEEIGYQQGILLIYNNLGVLYANYDLVKAEEYYVKALKQAKLIGAKRTVVYLHNNLGAIEFNRFMLNEALANYRESLKIAREMNFPEGIIFSNISLSEYYREQGKTKVGKRYLERALKAAKKLNTRYLLIDCLEDEIEYFLLGNQSSKAVAMVDMIVRQLRKEYTVAYKVHSYIYRGKVLVHQKKFSRAQVQYKKAADVLRSFKNNRLSGEVFYLRGVAYKKAGKYKTALKMLLEANHIFEKVGNLRFLDKIEHEIADTNI